MALFKVSATSSKQAFQIDAFVNGCLLTLTVIVAEKTSSLTENIDNELLTSMRQGVPHVVGGVPKRVAQENDAIPKVAPKWLKHDR